MISRFWPAIVVLVLACVAAAALLLRTPPASLPATPAAIAAPAAPVATATAVLPGTKANTGPTREPAGYDHYRAEMKRIRAERNKAQALEANERCIGGVRYRKVGSAWERAGNC
ncbi:hypothetical protein [Lysobacter sp. Root494]|uniref:hypothetical protein n=1 Tax=Lysobacter sp. Root494 TaxID=1736549 RepID=UPI000AF74829|nr:hypothetical protein [Lysobacter sp. Root494]